MDPCPFVRLTVGNLALKIPTASKQTRSEVHPSLSSFFCKIKLKNFPTQLAFVPLVSTKDDFENHNATIPAAASATFTLSKPELEKLAGKSMFSISVYMGKQGGNMCGILGNASASLIGKLSFCLDIDRLESRAVVFHDGWVSLKRNDGACSCSGAQLYVSVKAKPDPRFVFQFDGDPECSPQVFQVQGSIRQPVFTCKFSFRNPLDRTKRSSSFSSNQQSIARTWLSSFQSDKDRKERKGWSITVHDLSGSPIAAASILTPFVASPGTDRVTRSNPGSWLILKPENRTWKPWGRLEAWREVGGTDRVGYRFELVSENATAKLVLVETTINTQKGGKFVVDLSAGTNALRPGCSPRSSGDYGNSVWAYCVKGGFVMSASVEGKGKYSKPTVEVGVQHVSCAEDAAAFVALAATVDLSMDACRLFSHKLRKELCQPQD